jgi:uncharacterized protein
MHEGKTMVLTPRLMVVLVCGSLVPGAARAQAALTESVPHITVIGRAHTEAVPDYAVLSLAVVTEKPTASAAAAANAQAAQNVVDTIKAQGIDPKDVQTSEVSLTPIYDTVTDAVGHESGQKLRGYQARNGLAIRVRAIGKAGALAAQLIDTGANEFQGISFGVSQEDEIYAKLNDAAMRDALRAAKAYLPAAGVSLGRVLEIAPNDVGGTQPRTFAKAMVAGGMAPVPIEPGTLSYDSQVRVTWELVAPY